MNKYFYFLIFKLKFCNMLKVRLNLRNVATIVTCLAASMMFTFSLQAQEKDNNFGVFANVGGFALMGPTIGAEFTLGNKFIFEAAYRLPKMGGIMTAITDFDGIDGTTEIEKGYGVGLSVKRFFPRHNGGWYSGLCVDFGYLEYRYHIPYIDPWGHRTGNLGRYPCMNPFAFGGNAGYKFQLPSGLYFRAGAYLGVTLSGEINYYDDSDHIVSTEKSLIYPFANLDISIGFRF